MTPLVKVEVSPLLASGYPLPDHADAIAPAPPVPTLAVRVSPLETAKVPVTTPPPPPPPACRVAPPPPPATTM